MSIVFIKRCDGTIEEFPYDYVKDSNIIMDLLHTSSQPLELPLIPISECACWLWKIFYQFYRLTMIQR